ncbi:MAG: tRNA (adenosine(37)-N6)-threonylcarbamoyltransferase complex dimerization subunit type 1 TsaB [Deltaproteobacteria bacterium]|nr:tRNA (adenosine(37)-N6)-threonylcarbamoyltransferase complex dimerization subunit type 1 TsaB [Deltaproteobacteria bacterium]
MIILSIDTSQKEALVVVSSNDQVLSFVSENIESSCSQRIIFMIDQALKKANIHKREIDGLGCVVGPGSFTGIRIGIATVSALAYAKQCRVAPVCSLEYRVYHAIKQGGKILSVLPSNKSEVFACLYPGGQPYIAQKCVTTHFETPSAFLLTQNLASSVWANFETHNTVEYFNVEPLYVRKAYVER